VAEKEEVGRRFEQSAPRFLFSSLVHSGVPWGQSAVGWDVGLYDDWDFIDHTPIPDHQLRLCTWPEYAWIVAT